MNTTKGFFDALFSDYLLPHEKRIAACAIAFLLCLMSIRLGSYLALKLSSFHYDRPTDSIVITLGKTEFTRQNLRNP